MFLFVLGILALLAAAGAILLGVKGRNRKGGLVAMGVAVAAVGIVLIVCSCGPHRSHRHPDHLR